MTHAPTSIVPLNYSEHGYVALDGLMGSTIQPYLMRLSEPLAPDAVRAVMRELVSAYPRLRGVAEPGAHVYSLRILPDDDVIDQLFEVAWRIHAHLDAADDAAMEALHVQLVNEVVPLERGLACRFHYVPHPRTPVLVVSVHHLLADGRTMVRLLTEIMHRLNDGPPMALQSLDAPSMLGAVRPEHWWQWPRQMWVSRRHSQALFRQLRSVNVQQVLQPDQDFASIHMVKHHTLPVTASALRVVARKLDVSLNSLIAVVLAEVYLAQAPNDPRAAAVIRQAMDLRKLYPNREQYASLWGNHVASFLLVETGRKTLSERAASVKAQVATAMTRFERREMFWLYPLYEFFPLLGRTMIAHSLLKMKRRQKLIRVSCHATNIGNVSSMQPADARVRLVAFVPAVATIDMTHVVVELEDRISMPMMWERREATPQSMDAYLARLDEAFVQLVREHGNPQQPAPVAAAAAA